MSWLSKKWNKKAISKGFEKGMDKAGKKLTKAFTRPSAWRSWQPFKDRGLGLGKAVTGLAQAFTNPDSDLGRKLEYMATEEGPEGASSLEGAFNWFSKSGQETRRAIEDIDYSASQDWEDWQKEFGTDALSDSQILDLFARGDRDEIKGYLKHVGAEDIGDNFLNWLQQNMFDVMGQYKANLTELFKGIDKTKGDFSSKYLASRRGGGEGFGQGIDEDSVDDLMHDLYASYGDARQRGRTGVVDEILRLVERNPDDIPGGTT